LDYFDRIQPSRWGYLIWSQFPITVYIEPISSPNLLAQNQSPPEQSAQAQRQITWYQTVLAALDAWQPYLPLTVVDDAETANIIIRRSAPALQRNEDGSLGRARSAETRYQISLAQASPPPNSPLPNSPPQAFLAQQFTILLSDRQAPTYLQNTACHEIGHALGLWGHSLDPADVMYGVQTHQPAAISDRDVNTLKRLYQQPTRLGWSFNPALPPE
jgi:predicted Zn-dependent protease